MVYTRVVGSLNRKTKITIYLVEYWYFCPKKRVKKGGIRTIIGISVLGHSITLSHIQHHSVSFNWLQVLSATTRGYHELSATFSIILYYSITSRSFQQQPGDTRNFLALTATYSRVYHSVSDFDSFRKEEAFSYLKRKYGINSKNW